MDQEKDKQLLSLVLKELQQDSQWLAAEEFDAEISPDLQADQSLNQEKAQRWSDFKIIDVVEDRSWTLESSF